MINVNRKIIILISLICFSILLGGCIDNKEDGNNKKADEQFIVIRIKSISFTNETYEDRIYIDLMIGNINNTILFKENTWQNVIRLNSPKNNEEYPFKIEASVGSNNSETFDFIGDFNYFCGNITFSNEEIIIEINP